MTLLPKQDRPAAGGSAREHVNRVVGGAGRDPRAQASVLDQSGPDVISTTVFEMAPSASGSQNVSGALNATLSPGWYAVIFGAGRAGTKGQGIAFGNNTKLAGVANIFVLKQSTQGFSYTQEAARLFVEGTLQ